MVTPLTWCVPLPTILFTSFTRHGSPRFCRSNGPSGPGWWRRTLVAMAWLFHVIERDDQCWVCRHGEEIDQHAAMDDAVEHCRKLAAQFAPAAVVVHRQGVPVVRIEVAA
jgi:hypothetical protein